VLEWFKVMAFHFGSCGFSSGSFWPV